MTHNLQKTFVLSLGGSLMVPENIDQVFLKKFVKVINKKINQGYKFIIIAGGGKVCRHYQKAALALGKPNTKQLDILGIALTKVNALLLQIAFGPKAHPVLLDKRGTIKNFAQYPLIIGCGWEPGCSTDFDVVQTAIDFGIKNIINLTNQDYVYSEDPQKNPFAQPLKELRWKDFFKYCPQKRTPGMNTPFDPLASRLAQKNHLTVIIANGKNLSNLEKIFAQKPFRATIIYP
jgi:uridylate kinase